MEVFSSLSLKELKYLFLVCNIYIIYTYIGSEEEIRLSVVEESKEKLNKNEGKRISEGSEESKLVINLINASEETRESVTLLNNKICPECQKEVFRSDLITCSECKDKYCVYCYKHNKGCNDVHICTNCLFCVYCKQYHCASCSVSNLLFIIIAQYM